MHVELSDSPAESDRAKARSAKILAELGATVIDADKIAHSIYRRAVPPTTG